MLRFLTGLPPGKVRFTIIDPVGLGENFAAFMHLADHDEKLVTSQIWTEPQSHRTAAHRPHRPHRERDPEVSAEPVQDDRGLQPRRRRSGRTLSRAGHRQLPGELHARGGETAHQHRLRAARRAASARWSAPTPGRPCRAISTSTTSKPSASRWPGRIGAFIAEGPGARPVPARARPAAGHRNHRPAGAASRQGEPRSRPRRGAVRLHRAAAGRRVEGRREPTGCEVPVGRAGATRRQIVQPGPRHRAARPRRRQDRVGQIDAAPCPHHQPRADYSPDEVELYLIDFKKGVEFKGYADAPAAACPGGGDRERARVRPERACSGWTAS